MKYSELKGVKDFCEGLDSTPDWRECVSHIQQGSADFTIDGVRFINSFDIDEIQQSELSGDEYIIGCFNSSVLAGVLGVPSSTIDALQKVEAFEAIGQLVLAKEDGIEELQKEYARLDGYGHHFNHYDFSEEELSPYATNDMHFHVFDNRS